MFLLTYKTKQNKSLANVLMIFYYKNFDANVTFNYCTRVWSHSATLNNLYLFIFYLCGILCICIKLCAQYEIITYYFVHLQRSSVRPKSGTARKSLLRTLVQR